MPSSVKATSHTFDCRYLDPLFFGDYPEVMRQIIGDQLPKFSEEDKELLKNPMDFVGLNHYTSRFIAHVTDGPEESYYYKAQAMDRLGNFITEIFYVQVYSSFSHFVVFFFYHQSNGKAVS